MSNNIKDKKIVTANDRWLIFHDKLMGINCFLEGKRVAKSTVFWMSERLVNLNKEGEYLSTMMPKVTFSKAV